MTPTPRSSFPLTVPDQGVHFYLGTQQRGLPSLRALQEGFHLGRDRDGTGFEPSFDSSSSIHILRLISAVSALLLEPLVCVTSNFTPGEFWMRLGSPQPQQMLGFRPFRMLTHTALLIKCGGVSDVRHAGVLTQQSASPIIVNKR